MDDTEITERINELVAEEHDLEHHASGRGLSSEEEERRKAIEVGLDECWDLLRQRRARRDAGQDPSLAHARSEEVVEHYQQ